MKLVFFAILVFSFQAHAQLDPAFFGTYRDEPGNEVYTIYTLDEVAADCFLFDFQQFDFGQLVKSSSGYGHCDGPNGHMELTVMNSSEKREVEFMLSATGERKMIVYKDNQPVKSYSARDAVQEKSVDATREMYFRRSDGLELTFRIHDEKGTFSFSLFQPATNGCKGGEYTADLKPVNEELNSFIHQPFPACTLQIKLFSNRVEVLESGANDLHPNCVTWSGTYLLNQ